MIHFNFLSRTGRLISGGCNEHACRDGVATWVRSRLAGNSDLMLWKSFGQNSTFLALRVVVQDFYVGTFNHSAYIDILAIVAFSLLRYFPKLHVFPTHHQSHASNWNGDTPQSVCPAGGQMVGGFYQNNNATLSLHLARWNLLDSQL